MRSSDWSILIGQRWSIVSVFLSHSSRSCLNPEDEKCLAFLLKKKKKKKVATKAEPRQPFS
jgi:hypothetical protein